MSNNKTQFDPKSFEHFLKLIRKENTPSINKFKESYGHFLTGMNDETQTYTLGFHFTLDLEDEDCYNPVEILKNFPALKIYVGNNVNQSKLREMGYSSIVNSYFEDGGFVVVTYSI